MVLSRDDDDEEEEEEDRAKKIKSQTRVSEVVYCKYFELPFLRRIWLLNP